MRPGNGARASASFPLHGVELHITDEQRSRLPRKFQVDIPNEADGRLWVRHPWTVRAEGQIGWGQHPWGPVLYRIVQIHHKHQNWSWDLDKLKFGPKSGSGGRPQGPVELFDPRRVLRHWTLASLGMGEIAERATIRVRATPQPGDPDLYSIDMLNHLSWIGNGADAWDLDVDAERGLVLRLAAMVQGACCFTVEFTTIKYDELIEDAIFTFGHLTDQEPPLWHHRLLDLPWCDPFLP